MNDRRRREHEIAAIMMAAVAGEACAEDLAKVDAWLRDDPTLGDVIVDVMGQEAWLAWQSAAVSDQAMGAKQASIKTTTTRVRRFGGQYAAAAALLIAIGALLGSIATRRALKSGSAEHTVVVNEFQSGPGSRYVAHFVQGTACLWNPETTARFNEQSPLRTGESLNLLEGVAEFQLDWFSGAANLKLEGPAHLVLTAERGASLSRGKVTAEVATGDGAFVLGTPNGQVEISQHASIGVAIRGDAVELHVFNGRATFVAPWAVIPSTSDRFDVRAGDSVTISSDGDGRIRQVAGRARPSEFVAQISMRSDDLEISQTYVDEVLRSRPVVYWRFNGAVRDVVPNEVGARYGGRVHGAVQWIDERGNGNVEFGSGLSPDELHAYILADEPLTEELSQGYTIEMWIKPSHYHWGTIVSLIGDPPQDGDRSVHGMLFELGGPITFESSIERPGRLRFLHRSPPSDDLNTGTSCFSSEPYALRQWQHVAAVKDGGQMRLYVNGQLVATGEDATQLPTGLSVIIGQLDENRLDRPFAGQIDEVVVHQRALEAEELQRRYELVRKPRLAGSKRAI
jgi:hypothetical protein